MIKQLIPHVYCLIHHCSVSCLFLWFYEAKVPEETLFL